MSIEKARLLIRVANQISDGSDRRSLLAWADEILAGSQNEPVVTEASGLSFPIPVFRRYKGKTHSGQLLRGWRIELNGRVYPSVSAAAIHISGHNENGWRSWRYFDESNGGEHAIDKLREGK
ncbi:MAG: hypothetical protein HY665_06530 [Chloroflexi bacterium]|nr:hypothetical protein [Chloroflexota bacterium]